MQCQPLEDNRLFAQSATRSVAAGNSVVLSSGRTKPRSACRLVVKVPANLASVSRRLPRLLQPIVSQREAVQRMYAKGHSLPNRVQAEVSMKAYASPIAHSTPDEGVLWLHNHYLLVTCKRLEKQRLRELKQLYTLDPHEDVSCAYPVVAHI